MNRRNFFAYSGLLTLLAAIFPTKRAEGARIAPQKPVEVSPATDVRNDTGDARVFVIDSGVSAPCDSCTLIVDDVEVPEFIGRTTRVGMFSYLGDNAVYDLVWHTEGICKLYGMRKALRLLAEEYWPAIKYDHPEASDAVVGDYVWSAYESQLGRIRAMELFSAYCEGVGGEVY